MSSVILETTRDAFLGGALQLEQPARGFRAGLDAVMLAAAAPVAAGDRVLDLGCATGAVGLCIARRVSGLRVRGLEIDARLVAMANANAESNGLASAFHAAAGDALGGAAATEAAGLAAESFDIVVSNPPYFAEGRGTEPDDPLRARASIMPEGSLLRWVRVMTTLARPSGSLLMIHHAAALSDLLATLEPRAGGIRVLPLFPRQGQPAHRVIVRATKGSRAPLSLLPGLVLHGDGNGFTPAAEAVLRHGAALSLDA